MLYEGKKGDTIIKSCCSKVIIVKGLDYKKLIENAKKYNISLKILEDEIYYNIKKIKEGQRYIIAILEKPIVIDKIREEERIPYNFFIKYIYIYKEYILYPNGSIVERVKKEENCYFKYNYIEYYNVEIADPCANISDPIDYYDCLRKYGYSLWRPPIRLTLKEEVAREAEELGCKVERVIDGPYFDYISLVPDNVYEYLFEKLRIGKPKVIKEINEIGIKINSINIKYEENWSDCPSIECHEVIITAEAEDGRKAELRTTLNGLLLGYDGDRELVRIIVDIIRNNNVAEKAISVEKEIRTIVGMLIDDLERVKRGVPPTEIKYITNVEYKIEKMVVRVCDEVPLYRYNSEEECEYKTRYVLPEEERDKLINFIYTILHGLALVS